MARAKPVLTPELSKAARRELSLSQNNVITATGVQAYKLKQFEAGRFLPEIATLKKLRDYYEGEGVDLDALDAHATTLQPPIEAAATPRASITATPRPGFFISDELSQEQVDEALDLMDANDARIVDLVQSDFVAGLLGGTSDETEENIRELFGTLAESHLVFRFLQGKSLVGVGASDAGKAPKTIGDFLAGWINETSARALFAINPATPTDRNLKPAGTGERLANAAVEESEG